MVAVAAKASWDELLAITAKKVRRLPEEYLKRFKFEIKEINKQGANDYWTDLYNSEQKFDHNNNGLVFAWLLGITNIDPIKNNIEHIVESQSDMPDIDLDFLPIARGPVKQYIAETYGHDYICSVGSWVTYKPKSAMQDICRAHGEDMRELMEATTNLPDDFDDLKLDDLKKYKKEDSDEVSKYTSFYEYYEKHPDLVEMAYKAVGMIKTQGTHAGGVVISSHKLHDLVPMSKTKAEGANWASQWTEGKDTQLSKLGLIKFDILGLKTMYYIWRCCKLIKENHGGLIVDWSDMEPEERRLGWVIDGDTKIPIMMDDEKSIDMINDLQTESVFQHETPIQKGIIDKGGVRDFWDMVAYSSLGRPGPMDMIPDYIKNRDDANNTWKEKENPKVAEILAESNGIIQYQEQLASIWVELAGFTIPQAEEARKIVSKKWVDKMPQVEKRWLEGATKNIGKKAAKDWWKKMNSFGRYAFNKSHAVAYSIISFRCLYLKAHFGTEWWAAVMSICHPDKLTKYMGVARKEGVEFTTLDCSDLQSDFSVQNNKVSLGVRSIKGIGVSAAEKFALGRKEYESVKHFIDECGKSKTVLERFIKLGAFDRFNKNRQGLWMWYLYKYGSGKEISEIKADITANFEWSEEDIQKERDRQAKEYFALHPNRKKLVNKIANWKPKIGHRFDVPTADQVIDLFEDYTIAERIAFEKLCLGYYWSSPMEMFEAEGHSIDDARQDGILEAVIESIEIRRTATGSDFLVVHISDGIERSKVTVWGDVFAACDDELFKEGVGIKMAVEWNQKYKNFSLLRGEIVPLPRKV